MSKSDMIICKVENKFYYAINEKLKSLVWILNLRNDRRIELDQGKNEWLFQKQSIKLEQTHKKC